MKPLLSSKPGTVYEARHMEGMDSGTDDAGRTPAAPGPLASFSVLVTRSIRNPRAGGL